MTAYKTTTHTATPEDILDIAANELDSLQEELQEWYDNMPESLQNGDKAQNIMDAITTIGAVREAIEGIDADDEHFYPDARVPYTQQEKRRKNKQPSRQTRYDNVQTALTALKDFYESVDDEEDHNDIIDTLDEALQDVDIPGAWG